MRCQSPQEYLDKQAKAHQVELEGDLYTNALMVALEVPGLDDKGSKSWRGTKKAIPVLAMLMVSVVQLTMAWAVYLHVFNSMIYSNTRPLKTAYEMFVGSNITIPLHTVEALCGEWEDHEMKDFAMGPLSKMHMPDGTVFSADDSYSLFYNVKQPTRTWDYAALGSYRSVLDDALFVISEGVTLNPMTNSGYSLLFILVVCLFYLTLLTEVRHVSHFISMLYHFQTQKSDESQPTFILGENGAYRIGRFTSTGMLVGVIAVICRILVTLVLLMLGTLFLLYTTLKIDLILNGLALVFLLELGQMVYWSSVPTVRQQWIKDLEPVTYRDPDSGLKHMYSFGQFAPVLMFPFTFGLACLARWYQLTIFRNYFRLTAAICLFAGPTTPFARHDIVHPVAGFCDSLLGVKCAPHVVPEKTALEHGYCIVTDQTVTNSPTIQMYLDDPGLFANRYSEDGTLNSWVDWGWGDQRLYDSGIWMKGPYQSILRKNCAQMYQKNVKPDDVLVDDDKGETMDGAPFQCKREPIFTAVFGEVFDNLRKTSIEDMMNKVKDLTDPAVVNAMDNCKHLDTTYIEPKKESEKEEEEVEAAAPAPAGIVPPAAVTPVNMRARRHHRNQNHQHHLRHKNGAHRLHKRVHHAFGDEPLVGVWWWPQAKPHQGQHSPIVDRPHW